MFCDPSTALALFKDIPFLNGGLFEMLNKRLGDDMVQRVDGFSDHAKNPLRVPNDLFFAPEQEADLNAIYGTKNGRSAGRRSAVFREVPVWLVPHPHPALVGAAIHAGVTDYQASAHHTSIVPGV